MLWLRKSCGETENCQGTLTDILNEIRLGRFEREALHSVKELRCLQEWMYKALSSSDGIEVEKLNSQGLCSPLCHCQHVISITVPSAKMTYRTAHGKSLAYYLKSCKYTRLQILNQPAAKLLSVFRLDCYLLEIRQGALD
jgi:hypothetical protein